jgi:Up-Regulated in long-lived daf-2
VAQRDQICIDPIIAELQKKGFVIPEQLSSSPHTGQAYVTNNWGITLAEVTLRHRRSNNSDKQEQKTWRQLGPGDRTSDPLSFSYETGAGSSFDYWWVAFITNGGDTYTCKDNFYCSVSSSDNGIVQVSLNLDSRSMKLTFSNSSSCTVSLFKP